MSKKNKEVKDEVLTKKEQEQFKKDALKVLDDEIKGELVSSAVSDIKKELEKTVKDIKDEIDYEYKNELKESITSELKDDIKESIKKDQAKLSRRKSWKIFRLDIYILVLLVFAGFLIYRLYDTGNLDFIKDKVSSTTTTEEVTTTTTTTTKSLESLIKEYSYLTDDLKIANLDLLKGSYKVSDLSPANKLAMVYLYLGESDITVDGIIYQVSNEAMKNTYASVFGDDDYVEATFSVDGLNYAYSKQTDSYLAINANGEADETVAKNYVYDVVEENDTVKISSYVYVVVNGEIYNITDITNSLGSIAVTQIDAIKDKLTKVEYTFVKHDNVYYIQSINAL